MLNLIIIALFSLYTNAQDLSHTILKGLNPKEVASLSKDHLILKTQKVKDAVWPKIIIYQKLNPSPLQSVALFLDLDNQNTYVPNVIVSKPIKHVSAVEVHTKYEMKMPWPIPNSHYVHGSILLKSCETCYSATWYKVISDSADNVEGRADFIPFHGGTLMRYESHIVPKSVLAGLIKGTMIKDVKKSLVAIKKHINTVSANQESPVLLKYQSYILRSLKGEKVYEKSIIKNLKKRQ